MEFSLRSPLRRPNERCRLGRCPCPPVCFVTVGWEIGPKKQLGTWWLYFFLGWLWYLSYHDFYILLFPNHCHKRASMQIRTKPFRPLRYEYSTCGRRGESCTTFGCVPVSARCRSGKPKLFVTGEANHIHGRCVFFLVFATHILRPTSPVEEPGFLSS